MNYPLFFQKLLFGEPMYLLLSEAQNFGGTDTYLINLYDELKLRKNKVKV